ncbi:MAG: hypothetical protein WCL23_02970 [Candidatus Moraniibacteriota bacterium]
MSTSARSYTEAGLVFCLRKIFHFPNEIGIPDGCIVIPDSRRGKKRPEVRDREGNILVPQRIPKAECCGIATRHDLCIYPIDRLGYLRLVSRKGNVLEAIQKSEELFEVNVIRRKETGGASEGDVTAIAYGIRISAVAPNRDGDEKRRVETTTRLSLYSQKDLVSPVPISPSATKIGE